MFSDNEIYVILCFGTIVSCLITISIHSIYYFVKSLEFEHFNNNIVKKLLIKSYTLIDSEYLIILIALFISNQYIIHLVMDVKIISALKIYFRYIQNHECKPKILFPTILIIFFHISVFQMIRQFLLD